MSKAYIWTRSNAFFRVRIPTKTLLSHQQDLLLLALLPEHEEVIALKPKVQDWLDFCNYAIIRKDVFGRLPQLVDGEFQQTYRLSESSISLTSEYRLGKIYLSGVFLDGEQ